MDFEIFYGLNGVHFDKSKIASIDGLNGELIYRGYDIRELAINATFEEVVYLLWYDELPKKTELEKFTADLRTNYKIPEGVIKVLKELPKDTHPMHAIRTGISALASFDKQADDLEMDNIHRIGSKLVAQFPAIVAAFYRIREGKEIIEPDETLSIAANFLYMFNGEKPSQAATHVMDTALILHAEHGSNASAFVCRATASSLTDVYSAVTAAMASLKGKLHGGANTAVMKALEEIGNVAGVEDYVLKTLAIPGGRVMGFGHRVYKVLDPRAVILKKVSHKLAEESGDSKWFEMSVEMERVMDIEMDKKGKQIKPNVDFYSASVYRMLGFPGDMYTPIFAVARISGWMAHLYEQYANNRLMRPRLVYEGQKGLKFKDVSER